MKKRILALVLALLSLLSIGMAAFADDTEGDKSETTIYDKPKSEDRWILLEEEEYEKIYDIPYCGENSASSEILHLLLPKDNDIHPVLVFVHGGAWSANNSKDHKVTFTARAALRALDRGYAVALVDYSLRGKKLPAAFPTQIYEIKAAVRFLRSVADQYNLDSNKIALLGESAGGMLVDIVGTTNGESQYNYPDFGNMDYSSDVQAVIGQYSMGQTDAETIIWLCGMDEASEDEIQAMVDFTSALNHVDANDPPFYLEHGLIDTTISYTQSCDLYNALFMAGVEKSELHLFPGMEHAVTWFQTQENADDYLRWLDEIFER